MAQLDSTNAKAETFRLTDAIMAQVANGDSTAFRTLYYSTCRAVYAYSLSILKNPQDAEDATQDTYLLIREKVRLYVPCGKPLAWIFTLTKNLCLMRLRSEKHRPLTDLESDAQFIPSKESQPEDRIVLEAALNLLDEQSRQVVILHAVTGLRHREIASALGIPLSTVISRYHRSLAKLRAAL